MAKNPPLLLFSRPGCHLCEEARELLTRLGCNATIVNIETDIELLSRYRTRIPVIKREDSGAEMGWPFDAEDLADFIQ